MKDRLAVGAEYLRRTWSPAGFEFVTTADLPALEGLVGQEQAVQALTFGLSIRSPGYNIYVAGPAGTGKSSYTSWLVRSQAGQEPMPPDWVYLYNFDRPDEPLAVALPAGTAQEFAKEMEELIREAQVATMRALSGKEHRRRREEIVHQARWRTERLMDDLEQVAAQMSFGLTEAQEGLVSVPLLEGQPMTEEQFNGLESEQRRELAQRGDELQGAIAEATKRTLELERSARTELRRLDLKVAQSVVSPLVTQVKERQKATTRLVEWLGRVEQEIAAQAIPQPTAPQDQNEALGPVQRSGRGDLRSQRLGGTEPLGRGGCGPHRPGHLGQGGAIGHA